MKNLYLILIALLLLPLSGFSQGENDNWYFGDHAAVNFSTVPPNVLINGQTDQLEAVGTISDSNGNLLFYTDGETVWDSSHQQMMNGFGLNGHYSSKQLIILPHPGNPNLYFIFTTATGDSNPPANSYVAYSMVDMSLGNTGPNGLPLGSVTTKNTALLDDNGNPLQYLTEAITAVKTHNNGGYWVLVPNGNTLYSYLLDNQGFHNTPVTSNMSFSITGIAEIKASPELTNLPYSHLISIAKWTGSNNIHVNSFDYNSGTITNHYTLLVQPQVSYPYSSSFSPNGALLYLMGVAKAEIFVVDLDLFGSNQQVRQIFAGQNDLIGGSIQLAIDNNLYFCLKANSPSTADYYLHKIINPNSYSSSFANINFIYLNGGKCQYGLPQLIPILSDCQTNLTLTGFEVHSSDIIYEASNSITVYDFLGVTTNMAQITMDAGNYIELLPTTEFQLDVTGSILLKIEGCTDPAPRPSPSSFSVMANKPPKIIYLPAGDSLLSNVQIYPNPVNDILNIGLPIEMEIKSATLYNLVGKQMKINLAGNTINMSGMASGVYILKLETNQGTLTKKVIKQ